MSYGIFHVFEIPCIKAKSNMQSKEHGNNKNFQQRSGQPFLTLLSAIALFILKESELSISIKF